MTFLETARRDLSALRAKLHRLQSVRVCKEIVEGVSDDWERALGAAVATLPRVSDGPLARSPMPTAPGQRLQRTGEAGFSVDPIPAGGVELRQCRDFALRGVAPGAPADAHRKHFVAVADCEEFAIDGMVLRGGRNAIFLHRCRRFRITNIALSDLEGCGIILFDCADFHIEGVRAERLLASAVMGVGATHHGVIRDLTALSGRGALNADAGLHLNHCTSRIDAEDVPERCHEARAILDKNKRPSFILADGIHVEGHRAQGVYLEGAAACVVRNARLLGNNKEGICFDWGTVLCSLEESEIRGNGERARLTEEEIAADFVGRLPLLDDGSSSCKLPAVSFDNATCNRIWRCRIYDNFGGALKIVRASIANQIMENRVAGNARGDNRFFRATWLHSPDLGDANGEFADGQALLDLGPSYKTRMRGNVVERTGRERARSGWYAVRRRLKRLVTHRLLTAWSLRLGQLMERYPGARL